MWHGRGIDVSLIGASVVCVLVVSIVTLPFHYTMTVDVEVIISLERRLTERDYNGAPGGFIPEANCLTSD